MLRENYFETIMLVERLHRLFMEVVKAELDRMNILDINNVQCFILYNIGESKLTVGEISNRGYYLGSNVTYNLKKMVENEYLLQEQSPHDRRSSHITLTPKGKALFKRFEKLFSQHSENIGHNGITETNIRELNALLNKMESFWSFLVSHEIRS